MQWAQFTTHVFTSACPSGQWHRIGVLQSLMPNVSHGDIHEEAADPVFPHVVLSCVDKSHHLHQQCAPSASLMSVSLLTLRIVQYFRVNSLGLKTDQSIDRSLCCRAVLGAVRRRRDGSSDAAVRRSDGGATMQSFARNMLNCSF